MKGGDWIWILVGIFGLFRLLLLARKKKTGEDMPPPGPETGRGAVPVGRNVDPLKAFIDSLTDGYAPDAAPGGSPPPRPEEFSPPPSRIRRSPAAGKPRPIEKPVTKPPRGISPVAVPAEPPPAGPGIGVHFNFSRNPVIQGIILSEILGPPRGVGGGNRLPADL